MDDLFYWLALHHAPGIGPATFNLLLAHYPSLQELFESPDSIKNTPLSPSRQNVLIDYLKTSDWKQVHRALHWREENENHILTINHPEYPELLKQIDQPPALLYLKGNIEILSQVQLAIVGSRNPSVDGRETAFDFARHLASKGMVITSGMALGIDAQSHLGALSVKGESTVKGKSIAVTATGLDRIYPARHKDLAYQLVEQGAIVSEYPLGTGPVAGNFPQRNRIISGLSVGTLVIEAALKSGSLITARHALEQAREVFAIPGSIHNPLARGCHRLIKDGAKLVEKADDIIEELPSLMIASQTSETLINNTLFNEKPVAIDPLLPKIQQQILVNIGFSPVSVDHLAERTSLEVSELNANLVLLEVNDYIQSHPGGYFTLKNIK
jgi:DNA processing protein